MPYHVGLDLGQSADYTALAVVFDTEVLVRSANGTPPGPRVQREEQLQLVHLERFPLRTPYPDMVDHVVALLRQQELHPWENDGWRQYQTHPTLIVDATGVGAPVTDLLDKKRVPYIGVSIHGGDKVTRAGTRKYRVPKRDLVSSLEVPFHSGELKIAKELELRPVLERELSTFKRKINLATAHDSYEHWRESDHDDLVLACSLATWWCRRKKGTSKMRVIR